MANGPQHIAIIMDGNGRWATQQGLPRVDGHRRGVDVVDAIVTDACDLGISYLTLYAFSDENWQRPSDEVDRLMELLAEFVVSKCEKMLAQGVRLQTIGQIDRLPEGTRQRLQSTIDKTAAGDVLTLTLALSYGARNEICRAVNRAWQDGHTEMTPELMDSCLDTAQLPDPDLLIRTSGECRISNFLLWQLAYAEMVFVPVLWPEFTPTHLREAIAEFETRERRFGQVQTAC